MIQYAELSWQPQDFVVVQQGEIGDCFYVIVRGTVSVYARPTQQSSPIATEEIKFARSIQERARFGSELAQLNSGRCFGELSVLTKDGERNATIIADEPTLFIIFKREMFLRFVHEEFANELLRKSGFVQTCPLFKKWPSAYKNLLTECLHIRHVNYGEAVVVQGSKVQALYFITKGQTKLSMNTAMHLRQYKGAVSRRFYELMYSYYNFEFNEDDDTYKFPVLLRRRRKEIEGFFKTEMRSRPDIDICVVDSQNGMIGDVEVAHDLPTYSATNYCIEATTLYELDIPNFIRLIVRKNAETFETIQKLVAAKIGFRNSAIEGGIPLYAALIEWEILSSHVTTKQMKSSSKQPIYEQKRKNARGEEVGNDGIQEDRGKSGARSQKAKLHNNQSTGDVTLQNSQTTMSQKQDRWGKASPLSPDSKKTMMSQKTRQMLLGLDETPKNREGRRSANSGKKI